MKSFSSKFNPLVIRIIAASMITGAFVGSSFAQQSGLPINAAASVNGAIITNDMV